MTAHRYYFAAQYDWVGRRGFYLSLENETAEPVCQIDTLKIALGVADGNTWRFIVGTPKWEWNKRYHLVAQITDTGAALWLNNGSVGESAGGFAAHNGSLEAGTIPTWANGQTSYYISECRVSIRIGRGKQKEILTPSPASPMPDAVRLFNPETFWGTPTVQKALTPTLPITIEATFRFAPMPDWKWFQPYIDRFGQCRYVQVPDKVRSDADLKRSLEEERRILAQWGIPSDCDRFGGYKKAGWREQGTGFYRVVRKGDYWWLVTPDGYPCFYIGVCSVPTLTWEMTPVTEREGIFEWLPPKEGRTGEVWRKDVWGERAGTDYVCLHAVNLMRRFGEEWKTKSVELARQRLRTWGFSGVGKWGRLPDFPCAPVLGHWEIPNLVRHPDIFDPTIQAQFREHLRRQIEPQRNSQWVLGWSVGNEFDEVITRDEIAQILRSPGAPAGKRALIDHALEKLYKGDINALVQAWKIDTRDPGRLYTAQITPPDADLEALRRFYADRYYAWIYRTIKEIDPNHLYFGFWIVPGWWESEEDWALIARHCDVLGYDHYAPDFADDWMKRLIARTDKPILCGEFSFPAWYGGARAYGRYSVWAKDEAESGEMYRRWVADAAQHPACVGVMWFQYRDQPLTGRGPGRGNTLVIGEHFAFGLVDYCDRPKWEMLKRMRRANLSAPVWRVQAMRR